MQEESRRPARPPLAVSQTHPPQPRPRRGKLRFGLFSLLLATTLFAVAAAVLGHLLREGSNSTSTGVFIVLAAAAPMVLMIAASVLAMLSDLRRRRPPD